MLKREGHQVVGHVFQGSWQFRGMVHNGQYDLVMSGGVSSQLGEIRSMLDIARQEGVTTVVGGGIVSAEPELMTREINPDYAILGQGEVTAVELVEAIRKQAGPETVKGVAYCRNGGFFQTPSRPEIKDLDGLPFPDYEAFGFAENLDGMRPSDHYTRYLFDQPRDYPLVASRSCPYHCSFCYHTSGYKYRRRSLDSLMAEIEHVVPKYRINIITIMDELFGNNSSYVTEFCDRFAKFRAALPWDIRWSCQLRVAGLKAEMLDAMKAAGCYLVSYGFESYSAEVLASMKKHITPSQIHFALHSTLDRNIALQANFIFGDRAETRQTADETLAFWREHPQAGIQLGSLILCPASPDYLYCIERGLIKDRLTHIRHKLFDAVNMTAMTNVEFYHLVTEVLLLNVTNVLWVSPLHYDKESLTVQCPCCCRRVTYRNYRVGHKKRMICRLCHKRFDVSPRWVIWASKAIAAVTPRRAWPYYGYRAILKSIAAFRRLSEVFR